jgi:hypothetical protein
VREEKPRLLAGTSLAGTSGIGGVAPTIGLNTPSTTKFLNRGSHSTRADLDEVIIEEAPVVSGRGFFGWKSGVGGEGERKRPMRNEHAYCSVVPRDRLNRQGTDKRVEG